MNALIRLFLVAFFIQQANAQTTFFQDNFEGTVQWSSFGSNSPNFWTQSNCTSNTGLSALYVTSGGSTNDCTPSGSNHYGYTNDPTGSNSCIAYYSINASCYSTLTAHANIQIEGEFGQDYLEWVYSTNNGATWNVLGSPILANSAYAFSNQPLPTLLNGTSFWLGFRFTYNNSNLGNKAPAIDDFSIEGTSSDVIAPTITCPSNQTVYTNEFCSYQLPNFTGLASSSDACGIIYLTQNPVVGTPISSNTTITLTATDGSGNSTDCAFNVITLDTIGPKPTCLDADTLYLNTSCTATIGNYVPTVTVEEFCTPQTSLVFTQTPPAGTTITVTQNVYIQVTDLSGNSNSCFTHILLLDTINPTITCPTEHTVSTNNGCTYDLADLTGLVSMTDNCSSLFTYSQLPIPGTNVNAGITQITIQGTDQMGNSASCQFDLLVVDSIAPEVFCPSSVQIPVGSNCLAELPNVLPFVSATDNCAPSNTLIFNQNTAIGSTFQGTITVTVSATDALGNIGSCLLTVQAIDTTAPAVTCLLDTVISITGSCSMTVPNLNGTHQAVDNCSPNNTLIFTQNPPAGTIISNPIQVILMYEDTSGNTGVCYTNLIPEDVIVPAITCPNNQQVNIGSSCYAQIPDFTSLAVVTDNCSNYQLTQVPAPNSYLVSGSHVVTITVIDAAGNSASCTTNFSITETIAPTITCPANISTCNPIVNYTVTGNDNCFYVITQSDVSGFSSGDIFPIGTTQQTYLVTDSSGNTASCSFNVQVLNYPDTAKVLNSPMYLCNEFTTPIAAQPIQSGTGQWSVISGGGILTNPNQINTFVSNLSLGMNKLLWTVTSPSCGSKSDTLYIQVNQPPSTAVLSDSIYACANSGFLLVGNVPAVGSGTWSNNSGVAVNNIHAPIATITSIAPGFHTMYWTINNNGCVPSVDSIIVFAPEVATIVTEDTSLCVENLPITITGNSYFSEQQSYWVIIQGNATINNKYQPSTQISAAAVGNFQLVYQLNHDFCGNSYDTLRITFTACEGIGFTVPTLFTPNADGKNDVFFIPNLAESAPDCRVTIINRWGSKIFESIGYQQPWDGSYKGEQVPAGTYFYEIVSPSNQFEPIKGSISIIH